MSEAPAEGAVFRPARWRIAAGIAVLALLAAIGALLLPSYIANWKLQHYLVDLTDDSSAASQPAEAIREEIVNKAAALGLPVHGDDVKVSGQGDSLRIEVLYVVHVNLALYMVDLHFRPGAGG